jgi:AcrR family transcriptional regulator
MPYPEAARALLRDTLLDAAGDLMRERPWAKVTMADVARAAGVSRQTVYNELGGRREFAQAYVMREADRFLTGVEQAIVANADDPRAALTAAFDLFLSAAGDNPLVAAIAGNEGGEELLALVTVHGGVLLATATARLAALLTQTWPEVPEDDARVVSDCLVRLAISHAALPGGPSAAVARGVARVLGPLVDELLATGEAQRLLSSS